MPSYLSTSGLWQHTCSHPELEHLAPLAHCRARHHLPPLTTLVLGLHCALGRLEII